MRSKSTTPTHRATASRPSKLDRDHQLAESLAAAAEAAIEKARLSAQAERYLKWSQASAEVTRQLLSDNGERPLDLIARRVLELADADLVAVVQPDSVGDRLRVEVVSGLGSDELLGVTLRAEESLAGHAISSGKPVQLDDATLSGGGFMSLGQGTCIGPAMAIPLLGHVNSLGALIVGRATGKQRFTDADLEMASSFANHTTVALELAEFRGTREKVVLLEDRDRIARDLHDHVIQRLFAAGLTVQRVALTTPSAEDRARLDGVIDSLDDTIRQIRASIFDLRGSLAPAALSLRDLIVSTVGGLVATLGFEPNMDIRGLADTFVPADLADDIEAVVRETLTNTARHSHADKATLVVGITDGWLTIAVRDNGVGMTATARRSGLRNIRTRAERRGGSFSKFDQDGLHLSWKVPLRRSQD